jgi:hypothetical protein
MGVKVEPKPIPAGNARIRMDVGLGRYARTDRISRDNGPPRGFISANEGEESD